MFTLCKDLTNLQPLKYCCYVIRSQDKQSKTKKKSLIGSKIFIKYFINIYQFKLGHVATKPVFGVSDKARFKPVSHSTETS